MIELKEITSNGKLGGLTGNKDVISGRNMINLLLAINKFNEEDIQGIYLISELGQPEVTISNPKNNKSLSLHIHPNSSWIYVGGAGNELFVAEVSKPQLQYISDNLLTSDLVINWNLEWLGFIGYKSIDNPVLGKITISNLNRSDAKISINDFNDKVWSKISGEERYLVNVPNVDSSIFLKAPSEVDEWKEMMQQRADRIVKAMKDFERATDSGDFVTLAGDLKGIHDHLDEVTEKKEDKLDGLLFNKLFSGTGVNEASKGMIKGIIKMMEGLEKISNQIGHMATNDNPPKPFTFVGDKDTVSTFLFITVLLFNFIGSKL